MFLCLHGPTQGVTLPSSITASGRSRIEIDELIDRNISPQFTLNSSGGCNVLLLGYRSEDNKVRSSSASEVNSTSCGFIYQNV